MACLHILRTSGFQSNELQQCLSACLEHDAILLMDDGCYNLQHPEFQAFLAAKQNKLTLYVTESHAEARALSLATVPNVSPIPEQKIALLLFNFDNVVTWQ